MKWLPQLLSIPPRVSVHLVVPMSAVIDPDRLGGPVERQKQDDGVIDDLPPVRRELDTENCSKDVINHS